MSPLQVLIKQKSFIELTPSERDFVLKNMSPEDYEVERHIVLMVEKLKQNQAELRPSASLRPTLVSHMQAKSKRKKVWQNTYLITVSLLICLIIGIFLGRKTEKPIIIEEKTKNNVTQKDTILVAQIQNTIIIEKSKIQKTRSKKSKQSPISPMDYEDMSIAFKTKKTNFDWQVDDDEIPHTPKLKCIE